MAKHYDASVISARAGKPRDKATAEVSVLHAERRILAKFRNRKFFSLEELIAVNAEKFQKLEGFRQLAVSKGKISPRPRPFRPSIIQVKTYEVDPI